MPISPSLSSTTTQNADLAEAVHVECSRGSCHGLSAEARAGLAAEAHEEQIRGANLRLALAGCPTSEAVHGPPLPVAAMPLLASACERSRVLSTYLCPADRRIQSFLDSNLAGTGVSVRIPARTLILDQPGLAELYSLPAGGEELRSSILSSFRVRQGVLHNPANDRRTTKGVFHVAEGGLPVPADKLAVPKETFARLLTHAFSAPRELLRLPFTASQSRQAECYVSLLLRPTVCPEVPGVSPARSLEVRFFVPGALVSNLDFLERIFGNAGDPNLPENDAGLDVDHWTGHSGLVVLAPHLISLTKKELGLPPWDQATERQRREGMCWKDPAERYNGGSPFKATCRDERGVIVTVIADNYYGYCKKEVKAQISYSANLHGLCEEEHAGGAYVFPSYDLGESCKGDQASGNGSHRFRDVLKCLPDLLEVQPEGHAVDRVFPEIVYVPEDASFDLRTQTVTWKVNGAEAKIKLLADRIYLLPSGYSIRMEKPPGNRAWRLVGTRAEPTLCHKPCTVSGGGKSEISKSLNDAILQGPVFVKDLEKDLDSVAEILAREYSQRFKDSVQKGQDHRPILSPERTLGSVIKLLSPSSEDYSPEYNTWLASIPQHVKEIVFVVKRFYKPEWGASWRDHFTVDVIDGRPGNELKLDDRKLVSNYLRVGFEANGSWRVFGLRKDFHPAAKLQAEDDITASVVVPARALSNLAREQDQGSVKLVANCERQLFQRPDDAIHRGYDKQTEQDLARPGNFLSNFEPLGTEDARRLVEEAVSFTRFTEPMQDLIRTAAAEEGSHYFVSSAHPRLVDGKPSKNPRYLQRRPDLLAPREVYLSRLAPRLYRHAAGTAHVPLPVNAVLPGRRNNPPDPASGIRSLAVFNPLHHMELPELFIEYICSMTGKSPSTTGAGSEGAMTKGPFNALPGIIDLNAALVSHILVGIDVFISSAGHVGPRVRVDHDLSLLVPEVWSRMLPSERRARFLIEHGHLERLRDFEHKGKKVLASRLGHRITGSFARVFFGRVFHHPHLVLTDEMLRPELQDLDVFADGVDNIVSTHQRIASSYFEDGTVELACPPLRALLHVMAHGTYHGKSLDHVDLRSLFTREHLLESDWYLERLVARQGEEIALAERQVAYLEAFLGKEGYAEEAERLEIPARLERVKATLTRARSWDHVESLRGTIGRQPLAGK